jgi:hypothetical protein
MSDLSNEYENRVVNWLFRPAQSVTRPSTVYLALFTAVTDPEAGTGTEVTAASYARVDVSAAFSAPANGIITNLVPITFPNPLENWGTIRFLALMDAATAGNAITIIKSIGTPIIINASDAPPGFLTGELALAVL